MQELLLDDAPIQRAERHAKIAKDMYGGTCEDIQCKIIDRMLNEEKEMDVNKRASVAEIAMVVFSFPLFWSTPNRTDYRSVVALWRSGRSSCLR